MLLGCLVAVVGVPVRPRVLLAAVFFAILFATIVLVFGVMWWALGRGPESPAADSEGAPAWRSMDGPPTSARRPGE